MNKSFLNSVLGIVLGCLIVGGTVAGYWYWFQTQKAQPKVATAPPAVKLDDVNKKPDATPTDIKMRPEKKEDTNTPGNITPTKLTMARAVAGGEMYTPGQPVDVTITLNTEGSDPIRAIGIEEHIPAGWRFDSILEGAKPDITPRNPESQLLEFAWFNIPKFPASFTYRLIAGSNGGAAKINGETIFRTSGPEYRSGEVNTELAQSGPPAPPASAATPAPTAAIANPSPKLDLTNIPTRASSPAPPRDLKPIPPSKNIAVPPTITSDFAISFSGQDAGYKPGVEMPLEFAMDFAGADKITAFAVSLTLPQGWRFKQITGGEKPAVSPQEGASGEIALIWINTPQFPANTQFSLTPPANATGVQNFSGQIVYRTDGSELRSALVDVLIQPGA